MYIYVYANICIYPPAPCGPPGCEAYCLSMQSDVVCLLCYLQSAVVCLLPAASSDWWSSLSWCWPPGSTKSPPPDRVHWIWPPPQESPKTIKIQACSQDPPKSKKVSPGSPKETKMSSKSRPQATKSANK